MKVLALEFSTLRRSAAILELAGDRADVLASKTEMPSGQKHSGSPFEILRALFGDSFQPNDIEGIVVGLGPGSYTGIRSALAIAQGWNLAQNLPAAGVSSADAIAFAVWSQNIRGEIEVTIDAQRGEVYSATYEITEIVASTELTKLTKTSTPRAVTPGIVEVRALEILSAPKNINTNSLAGPDAQKFSPNGYSIFPDAESIGRLAARSAFVPPEQLEPIYLREPSFVKAPAIRHA